MVAGRKKELAFSLGGMGSASTNFYNHAYSRQGWAEVAAEVRERWQAGDRDGAAALVTDEMVLGTTLIGTEAMVARRLRVWRDAGMDTVRLYPAGDTLDARLTTLGRALDLVAPLLDWRPNGQTVVVGDHRLVYVHRQTGRHVLVAARQPVGRSGRLGELAGVRRGRSRTASATRATDAPRPDP